jgi:BTB/POZ domain
MAEEIVLSDKNISRASLQEELTRLYSQGFLTDITLSTEDGKNFEAHRILLAARCRCHETFFLGH